MEIEDAIPRLHWNYFLALEDDVIQISRFVELAEHNYACYSIELARLLLAASSEVDVVAKLACQSIGASGKPERMDLYRKALLDAYPALPDVLIRIPRFGLAFIPWVEWKEGRTPTWRGAYNKVKHERHAYFTQGNLRNALCAVAGLYTLLLYLYRGEAEGGQLRPNPKLFIPGAPFKLDFDFWGHEHTLLYSFNDGNR